MKTHQMHLQPEYFDYIKSGTKRIELRLYDEKRQQIALGDEIEFTNYGDKKLTTRVTGLLRYDSFRSLFKDFDIAILADAAMTKEELLTELEQFYTPEDQAKYGVLGIRVEIKAEGN